MKKRIEEKVKKLHEINVDLMDRRFVVRERK